MICCVLGALFLVNLIFWGRKTFHRLGIRKTKIDQEFVKTDPAGYRYYIDEFGVKTILVNNSEGGL